MRIIVRQRTPMVAPSDGGHRKRKREKDRQRRANELAAARALRAAYGGKGSRSGALHASKKGPPQPTLEEMLKDNPTALALLEGAKALKAKREEAERARVAEEVESWLRLREARAGKRVKPKFKTSESPRRQRA